jgi:hypothetical protein
MHTDVGGGYMEQNLSDIPLMWMIEEAKKAGLRIYPDHKIITHPDQDGHMHNSRSGFFGRIYRKKARTWNISTHGKPVLHESVILRRKNENNSDSPAYHPWIFNNEFDIEPWPESQRLSKEAEGLPLMRRNILNSSFTASGTNPKTIT